MRLPALLLLLLLTSLQAQARVRVRLGGIAVQGGYASGNPWFYSPGFYNPGLFNPGLFNPWFSPFWGSPFYGGYGYFSGLYMGPPFFNTIYAPDKGELKLSTSIDRDAEVYIDGALAGQAGKLRSFWLDPGAYNVEVRSPANAVLLQKRVYVLTGKVLKLKP